MASTSSDQGTNANTASTSEQSLKLAVAISLLRSKILQRQGPPADPPSESDALRWKRKAKDRKQEILRLREDLKEAEDVSRCDLFPQSASCKCYFFDNLGKLGGPQRVQDCSERRFNEVLRRRFLRQVRFKERKRRRDDPNQRRSLSDFNSADEVEHLGASVDFLVDLCDTSSPAEEANFTNWSHQAVDFILASLRILLSVVKEMELIEGIVSSLIVRLVRRMCSPAHNDESHRIDTDGQFYIQHLIRKLGRESYIGQRAILSVTQMISVAAESMLSMDPFDDAFPNMHECLFIMIQLIEFLVSDNFPAWSSDEGFDKGVQLGKLSSIIRVEFLQCPWGEEKNCKIMASANFIPGSWEFTSEDDLDLFPGLIGNHLLSELKFPPSMKDEHEVSPIKWIDATCSVLSKL